MLIDTSNAGKETSQTSLLDFSNWVHSAHFPGLEPMETPGVCSSFYIPIKITFVLRSQPRYSPELSSSTSLYY